MEAFLKTLKLCMNMTIWIYILEIFKHYTYYLYFLPIEETSLMSLHYRYEIMTKSLNLDQPPRLFVKYFTTDLCITWSLKMKDELKSFVGLCMKISKWSQSMFLFNFSMHSILTSQT